MLRKNELFIKQEKCEFAQQRSALLGIYNQLGLVADERGESLGIKEWETLVKVIELRSFLGLANYYRRFINGYAAKATPQGHY